MRVLIGLQEIAGYYAALSEGLRQNGVDVTYLELKPHPFGYGGSDTSNPLVRLIRFISRRSAVSARASVPVKAFWRAIGILLRLPLFLWALAHFDVFIFGYASTFCGYWDLPILKLAGKRVIYVFHGSDERPVYLNGAILTEDAIDARAMVQQVKQQRRRLARISRYADFVVSNPLSSQFQTRTCINYWALGVPTHVNAQPAPIDRSVSAEYGVRILHAPSHPQAKGTPLIRAAIATLRERGYRIEYEEIVGQPHSAVLSALNRCDFVVDQLYSDTPMATFAAEAAALGKAAIVGGYELASLAEQFPDLPLPPTFNCHPDDIISAIETLITDARLREELGRRAKDFVEAYWRSDAVAERFARLFDRRVQSEWLFQPKDYTFIHGVGLPDSKRFKVLNAILQECGCSGLCLEDKPHLANSLCQLKLSSTRVGSGADTRQYRDPDQS